MSITMEIADFDKINSIHEREMIKNAYNAITMTEGGWDFMKNFNEESFMFSSNPMIRTISGNMEKLGYNGHSGASFGWTMRSMEYLAKNGKDAFIASFE
jgi:hypothetical protein